MQSVQSQEVTRRFFEILDELVQMGHIHFMNDFYVENDINSRNIYQLRKDHSRDILQLEWLSILVEKYKVSGDYLLTGKGKKIQKAARTHRKTQTPQIHKTQTSHSGSERVEIITNYEWRISEFLYFDSLIRHSLIHNLKFTQSLIR